MLPARPFVLLAAIMETMTSGRGGPWGSQSQGVMHPCVLSKRGVEPDTGWTVTEFAWAYLELLHPLPSHGIGSTREEFLWTCFKLRRRLLKFGMRHGRCRCPLRKFRCRARRPRGEYGARASNLCNGLRAGKLVKRVRQLECMTNSDDASRLREARR